MRFSIRVASLLLLAVIASAALAREFHVSPAGDDGNGGALEQPLKTIGAAANAAQPGDTVVIHAGVYRERVTPPRGGTSDQERITYRAATGEAAVIKGSEIIKGWTKTSHDTWKVSVPNSLFGDFNPYDDLIHGDWFNGKGREHHTGAVYLNGHWLTEAAKLADVQQPADDTPLWFAEVSADETVIWAQFKSVDPNQQEVEINVRQTVFYPAKPGVNYLTIRGLTMMHAATPWAPPTAEQIGLIGTHWSKGWIIEDNDIRYSTCAGVALGKYGDQWDNTSQNSAEGYVKTIERALANGWSKENIGHHVVRHNHIAFCEQAGVVGSLGAVFSQICDNDIHDIHMRRLFTGAEMAGIKIHAAIDTLIRGNHIHRTTRGIWLDWMAQGARVTRNVLHDNDGSQDLFFEVNHGPLMVDHNVCLSWFPGESQNHWGSRHSVLDVSEGTAFAHNLFAAGVLFHTELRRETPFMVAHSTDVAGLQNVPGGDNRFYNNIFVNQGLIGYEEAEMPSAFAGNVYVKQAELSASDPSPLHRAPFNPQAKLIEKADGIYLNMRLDPQWAEEAKGPIVSSRLLGKAKVPNAPFLQPNGQAYDMSTDFVGVRRDAEKPFPGPFELLDDETVQVKVWPVSATD